MPRRDRAINAGRIHQEGFFHLFARGVRVGYRRNNRPGSVFPDSISDMLALKLDRRIQLRVPAGAGERFANAALRRLCAALLRSANGISMVVEAEDGASAVACAVHTHPDVAVFDNKVPNLSDIDAALQLRKQQLALLNSAVRV